MPWASTGLDATSLHRLRIPATDLESAVAASETGILWSGETVRDFAPYFSRREGSLLENLLVFPFVADGTVEAVLLVTDTPYFDGHVEHLRIILAAVGEPATEAMRSQRLARARTMRQSIVFKPSEVDVVTERIAARAEAGLGILVVQLADVVSQVATANDFIDSFRVWQDVLRATAALFASSATVCDADGHRALLLLHGRTDDDLELIVQHVAATLAALMPEMSDAPVLRYDSRRYPEDGSDLAALVHAIL